MHKTRKLLSSFSIFFVFIVFGVWEIINPNYWAGFIPTFMSSLLNPLLLVRFHGIVLGVIGLWLISGFQRRIAAIFSALIMLEIVISLSLSGFSDILVRDIAIFIFTLSLIFDTDKKQKRPDPESNREIPKEIAFRVRRSTIVPSGHKKIPTISFKPYLIIINYAKNLYYRTS